MFNQSLEMLPPPADRKKYRDPQPDLIQRVRDLGALSPKRDVFIKSLALGLRFPSPPGIGGEFCPGPYSESKEDLASWPESLV